MHRYAIMFLFSMVLLFSISFAWVDLDGPGGAGICTCSNTCADCWNALNNNVNCSNEVRLTNNIAAAGTCINDPTGFNYKLFDCQGNSITGPGSGTAVYLKSQIGNTITRCAISDFDHGIYLSGTDLCTIHNNTIFDITTAGIDLSFHTGEGPLPSYSTWNNVTENEVYNVTPGAGIASYSSDNNISRNTVHNSTLGIYIAKGANDNVFGHNVIGDCATGITGYSTSTNLLVHNNSISRPTSAGIYLDTMTTGTFRGNLVNDPIGTAAGIEVDSCTGVTLDGNEIHDAYYGIELYDSSGNTISGNTVHHNLRGFYFYDVSANTVRDNTIRNNRFYANTYDFRFQRVPIGSTLEVTALGNLFLPNSGALENYSNISFSKSLSFARYYYLDWRQNTSSLLEGTTSFRNKYINVYTTSGWSSLDWMAFHWTDAELAGYDESSFRVWRDWPYWKVHTPYVLDTGANTLNITAMHLYSYAPNLFGILEGSPGPICYCHECDVCQGMLHADTCTEVHMDGDIINTSGYCIYPEVNASNKLFDCHGYKIDGDSSGFGVYFQYVDNFQMQNCIISDFSSGLYLEWQTNSRFINNTVFNSGWNGIDAQWGCNLIEFINNTVFNNQNGFNIYSGAENSIFRGNRAYNNTDYGFVIDESENNTFIGNVMYNNREAEFYLWGIENITFTGNLLLNPMGTLENYTNLSLSGPVSGNIWDYTYFNWTASPAPLPEDLTSFQNKFIEVTYRTSLPIIPNVTWHWTEAELAASGLDESRFDIYKYNGTWIAMDAILDTDANTLTVLGFSPASVYAVVEVPEEGGGAEPECTWDDDCGYCEHCSAGSCEPIPGCEDECETDADCPEDEECSGGDCIEVECECGEIVDHECDKYECCDDSDCPKGYECKGHECELEDLPECEEDGDCSASQYCFYGDCFDVDCECGTIIEHKCIKYECCTDADCESGFACNGATHVCEEIVEEEPPLPEPTEIAKDVVPLVEGEPEEPEEDMVDTILRGVWIAIPLLILIGIIFTLLRRKKGRAKE